MNTGGFSIPWPSPVRATGSVEFELRDSETRNGFVDVKCDDVKDEIKCTGF